MSIQPTTLGAMPQLTHYTAAFQVVAAAGTAPFLEIKAAGASATKLPRVVAIRISDPTLTTAAANSITVTKRSTASTSGTAGTTPTTVPFDSKTDLTAEAVITQYTTGPTAGTAIGAIRRRRVLTQTATGAPDAPVVFDFRTPTSQPNGVPLRGTEALTAEFGSAPASAVTLDVEIEWTEEPLPT